MPTCGQSQECCNNSQTPFPMSATSLTGLQGEDLYLGVDMGDTMCILVSGPSPGNGESDTISVLLTPNAKFPYEEVSPDGASSLAILGLLPSHEAVRCLEYNEYLTTRVKGSSGANGME